MSQFGTGFHRPKKPGGGGTPDMGAGMRSLAQLTGNKALIAMLARRTLDLGDLETKLGKEDPAMQERELALAALAKLLEASGKVLEEAEKKGHPQKAFGDVKSHLIDLLEMLHVALSKQEGYKGELGHEADALAKSTDNPGKHRLQALVEMLDLVTRKGADIHGKLGHQLPKPGEKGEGRPTHVPELVKELAMKLKEKRDGFEHDKAPRDGHKMSTDQFLREKLKHR